jgi:hypothetical protein
LNHIFKVGLLGALIALCFGHSGAKSALPMLVILATAWLGIFIGFVIFRALDLRAKNLSSYAFGFALGFLLNFSIAALRDYDGDGLLDEDDDHPKIVFLEPEL